MSFRLRNTAQTFQRFITEVTRGLPTALAYIDHILVANATRAEHEWCLHELAQRLQQYGVCLNAEKSMFRASQPEILGHHTFPLGIRIKPSRVQRGKNFRQPTTLRKSRECLRLVYLYMCFIPHSVKLVLPQSFLLEKRAARLRRFSELQKPEPPSRP